MKVRPSGKGLGSGTGGVGEARGPTQRLSQELTAYISSRLTQSTFQTDGRCERRQASSETERVGVGRRCSVDRVDCSQDERDFVDRAEHIERR